MSLSKPPRALLTDVFGTVVDWRSSVVRYLQEEATAALNSPSSSIPSTTRTSAASVSWPKLVQQWRNSYYNYTRTYDPDTMPWKSIDQHHCEALIELLREHHLDDLWTDSEIQKISMIWHFLEPWSDSSPGLRTLNSKFETATLSNGNTALLTDLARHGNLPYKHIISAEDVKAYKPHPSVYLGAAKRLGLQPDECCLVAAHLGDLQAAKGQGFQTIYIERPQEEGWDDEKVAAAKQEGWVDIWIPEGKGGFEEVARRFGIQPGGGLSDEQKQKIEDDAGKGIYHEDASIIN